MTVHWLDLIGALILLGPPAPFSAAFQKSLLSMRRNSFANALTAARVWQNWIDLGRAVFGAYLLTKAFVGDPAKDGSEFAAALSQAAVLGLVLLAQTVRFFRTVQLLAPVFYLCGLILVLGSDIWLGKWEFQGVFAVVVGWVFAICGKNLAYQLPTMAVALAVAGYVLGFRYQLLLGCGLIMLPVFLSTLFRRRLLFVTSTPARV